MDITYLFEAGATKTTFLFSREGNITTDTLPGFNPNRYSDELEKALMASVRIEPGARIYFYGAGLVEEENKAIIRELFHRLYHVVPEVYDDVTGAARAGLGDRPGLVAIMGTGGVAAYYDGQKIIRSKGGYGYLIDDYGGGLELGKIILSAWLNGDLPREMDRAVRDYVGVPAKNFVRGFYVDKDLKILAGVVRIVSAFMQNFEIQQILEEYFDAFFRRHVLSLSREFGSNTLFVVGSIGKHFEPVIRKSASKISLQISGFDDQPAYALIAYHARTRTI